MRVMRALGRLPNKNIRRKLGKNRFNLLMYFILL